MSQLVYPTLPGLQFPIGKTPVLRTQVIQAVSGREVRGSYQQYPLYEFSLSYEFLRDNNLGTEADTLLGFVLTVGGMLQSFLYNDATDNAVTAQTLGTGNGTTTAFQLIRTIGAGGFGYIEPVHNVNAITGIYLNGVLTTAYTVNSTGLVTFTAAPASGVAITWTGTYYYRVRLLQDQADFSLFMQSLWELKTIKFRGSVVNLV